MDNESSFNKKIISEIIYIKKQQHALNKQSDTDYCRNHTNQFINRLSLS